MFKLFIFAKTIYFFNLREFAKTIYSFNLREFSVIIIIDKYYFLNFLFLKKKKI